MSEEIYKIITDCPNYSISNFGNVKNKVGDVLKANLLKGAKRIGLSIDGKRTYFYLGQLMAKYFLNPDHDNFYVVYKDGDKLNNRVDNLKLKYCETQIKVNAPIQTMSLNDTIKKYKLKGNWKFVKNDFNYVISDVGKIIDVRNGSILKEYTKKSGYVYVILNVYFKLFTHVLIAEVFLNLDFYANI